MKRAFSDQSQRLTRQRFEGFLRRNEQVLSPTLQRAGWMQARATNDGYLTEFERVIKAWVGNRYSLALPTPKSIDFDPDVAASLPSGGGYLGPQSQYSALVRQQEIQRAFRTLENIASGPIGAFGYLVGGDALSDLGALIDGAGARPYRHSLPGASFRLFPNHPSISLTPR